MNVTLHWDDPFCLDFKNGISDCNKKKGERNIEQKKVPEKEQKEEVGIYWFLSCDIAKEFESWFKNSFYTERIDSESQDGLSHTKELKAK